MVSGWWDDVSPSISDLSPDFLLILSYSLS